MALEITAKFKDMGFGKFRFLKNFEKRIKRAARLFDTLEYAPAAGLLRMLSILKKVTPLSKVARDRL